MSVTYMAQVVMIEPVFERFKQWADSQGVIVNAPHEACYRYQHAAAIARGGDQ